MARSPEHVPRLLHLVRILVRTRQMPLARLARELDVTEAEVRADIELLSLCGVPPYGPENLVEIQIVCDRVRLSNRLLAPPPLQLSAEEAAGLRLALRLAEAQGWPERRALRSALGKLEAALLPERREGGRRLARRLALAPEDRAESRWLPLVREAVERRFALDVEYYSDGREAVTTRRIAPYRIVATARVRYLIAYCYSRRAVLTFRLDRLLKARRTAERFEPPADLKVADYLGDSPRTGPARVAVTVRFAPAAARLALETYSDARPAPEGSAIWKPHIWPSHSFARLILSWGGAAEVIEPAGVREAVRAYAQSVADLYAV